MPETFNSQGDTFEQSGELIKLTESKAQEIESAILNLENPTSPILLENTQAFDFDPRIGQKLKEKYQVNEEFPDIIEPYIPGVTTEIYGFGTNNPSLKLIKIKYTDGQVEEKFGVSKLYPKLKS